MVGGPWRGSCEDCSFLSSSSSSSEESSSSSEESSSSSEESSSSSSIILEYLCYYWDCNKNKCIQLIVAAPEPNDPCIQEENCCSYINFEFPLVEAPRNPWDYEQDGSPKGCKPDLCLSSSSSEESSSSSEDSSSSSEESSSSSEDSSSSSEESSSSSEESSSSSEESSSSSEESSSSSEESSSSSEESSSSSESSFYVCSKGSCIRLEDLGEGETYEIGPFFGDGDCYLCYSSSSSGEFAPSSSSEESSSSSEESSSSSGDCPPCKMLQIPCACWKVPLSTEDGIKEIGIPKYINLDFKAESICFSTYLSEDPGNPDGFFEMCTFQPPGNINAGVDCFSGCPCGFEVDLVSTSELSPGFQVETDDEESPIRVQVWESDNDEDCEEGDDLINPRWLTQEFTLKVRGCGNELDIPYSITFSESGYQITGPTDYVNQAKFSTCKPPDLCGYGGLIEPENYSILISGNNWQTRYRREYDDYTLSETQIAYSNLVNNNQSFQYPSNVMSRFTLNSEPTCRTPDTGSFCGCFEESLYNLIDLDELDSYEMPADGCEGKPLDIDVVCGKSGRDPGGNDEIVGGVTMYYTPYPNTVPVINNVAYDVLNLPSPPPGKINVIRVHQTSTRNQMRNWTCSNLKFATVRNDWKENPILGPGGSIGAEFTRPEQNVNFNWPYNDLYFSDGCPGGDSVNLIPC